MENILHNDFILKKLFYYCHKAAFISFTTYYRCRGLFSFAFFMAVKENQAHKKV